MEEKIGCISVLNLPLKIRRFLFDLDDVVGDWANIYYVDDNGFRSLVVDFVLRDILTFERTAPSCLEYQACGGENFSRECE